MTVHRPGRRTRRLWHGSPLKRRNISRLSVELDHCTVNETAGQTVLDRTVPASDVADRRAAAPGPVKLELEDRTAKPCFHIQPGVAAAVLDGEIEPNAASRELNTLAWKPSETVMLLLQYYSLCRPVDVVESLAGNSARCLDADGQLASGRARTLRGMVSLARLPARRVYPLDRGRRLPRASAVPSRSRMRRSLSLRCAACNSDRSTAVCFALGSRCRGAVQVKTCRGAHRPRSTRAAS